MDSVTLLRSDQLLLEIISVAAEIRAAIKSSRTRVLVDSMWSKQHMLEAKLAGLVCEFVAVQRLIIAQEANDRPYPEMLVMRFIRLDRLVKTGRSTSYGDAAASDPSESIELASAAAPANSAAASAGGSGTVAVRRGTIREDIDRRVEWNMRPLSLGFYGNISASVLGRLRPALAQYILSLPQYCHLIGTAQQRMLTRECVQYAFSRLMREEIAYGAYLGELHRSVFRLGDQKWPDFGTSYLPHSITAPNIGKFYKPLNSSVYVDGAIINARGLYSPASFAARFEIFTSGMFKKISDPRLFYSGSCMPACAMRSPLELQHIPWLQPEHEESAEHVASFWAEHAAALQGYYTEYYADADIDIVVECASYGGLDDVANTVLDGLSAWHLESRGREMVASDYTVLKECSEYSYKYTIVPRGGAFPRQIQLFRRNAQTPIGMVNTFHFDAVRAYYHCGDVIMTSSFIIAAMTGMCIDMRFISNGKRTEVPIYKYWRRGLFIYCVPQMVAAVDDYAREQQPNIVEVCNNRESWRIGSPHWMNWKHAPRYVDEAYDPLSFVQHVRANV